jgi:hypothetical protein
LIIRRIVLTLVAIAAMAAAAAVAVFAAAFAVFALARQAFGPAGAAGVVLLAAALLMVLIGLIAGLQARAIRKKIATAPSLLQQLYELAREQPIVSVGALVGAVALAIRNPNVIASVVKTFLNQKRPRSR